MGTSSVTKQCSQLGQLVKLFQIMANCTVILVKAFISYNRSLQADLLHEGCARWYSYKAATEELSPLSSSSIRGQKRADDLSFITRKVEEAPLRFNTSQLITMSEARSVSEGAGVQFNEPVLLHLGSVSDGK